jgi:magnesium transporter
MLTAYLSFDNRLQPLPAEADLSQAAWIDVFSPTPEEEARVRALGVDVPTLAEMEEIEISNRLYRDEAVDYVTIVVPGLNTEAEQIMGPVCFAIEARRLVTIRHHCPRPFETYAPRAGKSSFGCNTPDKIFVGLIDEVVGRLADHLETAGRGLDTVSRQIYRDDGSRQGGEALQAALFNLGGEGERISRVRLALLTLGRALNYVNQVVAQRMKSEGLSAVIKGQSRDIDALEIHADFLSSRLGLLSDATMGMINLAQNGTVRILSLVAVLFSPPTLIASIYGMNFAHMPELAGVWSYPLALLGMLASALVTYAVFRWRGWL